MLDRFWHRHNLNSIRELNSSKRIRDFPGGNMKNLKLDCRILLKTTKKIGSSEIINFIESRKIFLKKNQLLFSQKFKLLPLLFSYRNFKKLRSRQRKRKSKINLNLHHYWWKHKLRLTWIWVLCSCWKDSMKTKRLNMRQKSEISSINWKRRNKKLNNGSNRNKKSNRKW